jgi:hypothetical protein
MNLFEADVLVGKIFEALNKYEASAEERLAAIVRAGKIAENYLTQGIGPNEILKARLFT